MDKFLSCFDGYTIKARMLPVFIAILPIILIIINFYNIVFSLNNTINIGIVILIVILLYILSFEVRMGGKNTEKKLKKEWGAFPTTILLRYKTNFSNAKKYHELFKEKLNIDLPNKDEENNNIQEADYKYNAAIDLLRERTRDNKILLDANINYGFIRNLLGVKFLSLFMSSSTSFLFTYFLYEHFINHETIQKDIWLIFITILLNIFWIFFVSKKRVKQYADIYAEQLLKCLYNL